MMSEIFSLEKQATIGNENRAGEEPSSQDIKDVLRDVSQKLLSIVEKAESFNGNATPADREGLYMSLEKVQQNISSLLETKNKNIQSALQKVLEFQNDSRIKARLITENIFILTPSVVQWLSFLSRQGEQELPRDDKEMLIELSSNLQQSIPNKLERILARFKIFNSYIRLADSSTFKDMYSIRKYAERFNKKDSSLSR